VLRAHAEGLAGRTCLLVSTPGPLALDLDAMLSAHRANAALVTVAVARRPDGADALIVGEDGRVMAVQPAPHPDEALSDLSDAGVYAVEPAALDHMRGGGGAGDLTGGLLTALLAWDAPVYAYPLGA
jgi:NDP-sugar pyrophosphorylase family protein